MGLRAVVSVECRKQRVFENAQAATSQVILNALLEFGLERVVGEREGVGESA